MSARIAHSIRWKACAGCLAFMLPTIAAAGSDEEGVLSTVICAQRGTLLETLVEANGEVPNTASAQLDEVSTLIMQARAACGDGRVDDAVALYDHVIAGLASVVKQRNK